MQMNGSLIPSIIFVHHQTLPTPQHRCFLLRARVGDGRRLVQRRTHPIPTRRTRVVPRRHIAVAKQTIPTKQILAHAGFCLFRCVRRRRICCL